MAAGGYLQLLEIHGAWEDMVAEKVVDNLGDTFEETEKTRKLNGIRRLEERKGEDRGG